MKRITTLVAALTVAAMLALAGCGATTQSTTTPAQKSTAVTTTTSPTATKSIALAQDTNPSQPNYWSPQYEGGLVSACVRNKIEMAGRSACVCIVAALQSHDPALYASAADRTTVADWMTTASGNPFGLHEYALNCANR